MSLNPLTDLELKPFIEKALSEDLGQSGDITSKAIIASDALWEGVLVARQEGILAGIDCARLAFQLMDPKVNFEVHKKDGSSLKPKEAIATIRGAARAILAAERVALNFICHLSGIATATDKLVEAVKPYKARIRCSRKTLPGLRLLEKYAVRAGKGVNHRFGLYDEVLIKDNHIAAVGDLREAVFKARKAVGDKVQVELEVDNLSQLEKALDLPLNTVLLDNMDPPTLKKAVEMVGGRFLTEASGGVAIENIKALAATGVDYISVGAITHSAHALDIGLDEVSF